MSPVIKKSASAGSLESNDVLVTIFPGVAGIEIKLHSIVDKQFGKKIRECALDVLKSCGIDNAVIHIQDMGAIECTIRARIETAVTRALKEDRNDA